MLVWFSMFGVQNLNICCYLMLRLRDDMIGRCSFCLFQGSDDLLQVNKT